MKHELRIDTPDGFRETTPLHGITTEKSFWLNNRFEEGVLTRYSQEKNLSRKIIPNVMRIFPKSIRVFPKGVRDFPQLLGKSLTVRISNFF
jgi:hypothetical protein